MTSKEFKIEDFHGMVVLKEWMMCPDGQNRICVVGTVSIHNASEVAGFELGQKEANWFARIESPDGKESMNILGCQVRSVYQGSNLPTKTTANQWVM